MEVMLFHINSVDKNVQFTCERETEASITFLDIKLTRKPDGSLSTSTYRKPTHTDQYLHFSSHHPKAHKSSMASTVLRRTFAHSSTDEERKKELVRVCNTLKLNGYPHRSVTSKIPEAIRPNRTKEPRTNNSGMYICIPYIQGVSDTIKRILETIDIRVCFKPVNTIKSMVSLPKDQIPLLQKSGVIYKVKCGCCNGSYVGERKRRLQARLDEHKKAVQKDKVNTSAKAEHAWSAGRHIDWDSMRVLDTSGGYYSRLTLEANTVI